MFKFNLIKNELNTFATRLLFSHLSRLVCRASIMMRRLNAYSSKNNFISTRTSVCCTAVL